MTGSITLEEVEQMTALLALQDQLKLMAHVSERLSTLVSAQPTQQQTSLQERLRLAEQLLAEVEGVTDDAEGVTDSAESVRQLRHSRKVSP